MKLKPKQVARKIAALQADENRYLYGRQTGGGVVYKHPAKTATLIALAIMCLTPWQMKTYETTGQLPRPHRELGVITPVVSNWQPGPNASDRRKAARVDVQREVTPVNKTDKPMAVPLLKMRPKTKDTWVRNNEKYIKRQAKLKHYVATGEWKEFKVTPEGVVLA